MKILFLALVFLLVQESAQASLKKPNVLFIAVDDLRTSLGCYGDPVVKSPNIDRLAATARLFNRAYCQQAVCGPSRASILTGKLPDNTGVWHNRNLFRETLPQLVTLPQLFKNNGYHAQGLGKVFSGNEKEEDPLSWSVPHVLRLEGWRNYALPENNHRDGKGVPFEKADVPDDGYPDGQLANLAIQTLKTLSRKPEPFFLAVGFFKPHLPFNAPRKYWDLYDPFDFALQGNTTRTRGAPEVAYPDHLELGGYEGVPSDERVSVEQARDLRHGYYACVSYTDAQVGKLLDALKELDLEENTIVVLFGDHGYSLGEADHWCKDTNFELDTHVPLMIRVPGMPQPGATTDALTEYVDIYPTLAELAKLSPPSDLDGRSLVPILENPTAPGHDLVLSQFSRPFKGGNPEIMGYSIRTADHRYTRWIDWNSRNVLSEELYDYTSSVSTARLSNLLIERENLANNPGFVMLQNAMSIKMDVQLRARTRPVTLNVPGKKPQSKP